MRTFIGIIAAFLIVATAWAAATIVKVEPVTCANGFKDAYVATEIEPIVGCILAQFGVGCNGQPFRRDFLIKARPGDLQAPFDYQYSGVTVAGGQWYVKIDLDESQFVRAWGKKADGSYYEATLE